ncbi:flotillin-like FloA family protein [Candidatus Hydrogenedentota bacterium]
MVPILLISAFCALVVLIIIILLLGLFRLWLKASLAEANIPFQSLVGMRLRGTKVKEIVDSHIMAVKSDLVAPLDSLETHCIARGNIREVVRALGAAQEAGIELTFDRAAAIDLAGRDVFAAVTEAKTPRELTCNAKARAKDGVRLRVDVTFTIRTDLNTLVGGATEDTIIDRTTECMVKAIKSADKHEEILNNQSGFSQMLLELDIDDGTAFEILDIDVNVRL